MFFWVSAILLTIGAVLAVLAPLTRKPGSAEPAASHDLEVYRDQLAEVEREVERGTLDSTEADQARIEIQRRILGLAGDPGAGPAGGKGGFARMAGAAAVLSVPLVAWGVYGMLGSPDVPSQPLQARLEADPADATVDELVARAEAHLATNPEDGRGWDVIAPVYLRLGRAEDSVRAYATANRLLGPSATRESGLGEALATTTGGVVGEEAVAAFERAVALEPGHAKSLFYLATADAQRNLLDSAERRWAALLGQLPADSAWRMPTERALTEVRAEIAKAAVPGPTAEDVDAAAAMSEADRGAMIEGMVAQLDAKLRENPNDGPGWRRLVRSYVVMGRRDDAQEALKRGLAALDGGEADELANLAVSLGLSVEQ
ncbi:MAG: c-type cytochrome biogenesis protein CcmI [Rhizobiaceae bacterium]|nr:c-type cytochrome biogenesis protein CcmI [Rhizobiaceae bacterium]